MTAASGQRARLEITRRFRGLLEQRASDGRGNDIVERHAHAPAVTRSLEWSRVAHAARRHPVLFRLWTDHDHGAWVEGVTVAVPPIRSGLRKPTANRRRSLSAAREPKAPASAQRTERVIGERTNGLDQLSDMPCVATAVWAASGSA